jgi:hypothetical protein
LDLTIMFKVAGLLAALVFVVEVGGVQQPLAFGSSTYDYGLFTPFEDLRALPSTDFTTLEHPLFPNHSVRIKESDFCDGTVKCVFGFKKLGNSALTVLL